MDHLQQKPIRDLEERVRVWHNENLQHMKLCWWVSACCAFVIAFSIVTVLMRVLLWPHL